MLQKVNSGGADSENMAAVSCRSQEAAVASGTRQKVP